ncbi:MAG: HEPN domain-containing protein [Methanomicrobiales archaeon]
MARQARDNGFFEWACFISQQAALKAIKSVYQRHGAVAWGHSVMDLLSGLQQRHNVPQPLFEIARSLDRSYVPARYPDGFPRGKPADYFGQEEANDAVSGSERILQFCDGLLA